MPVLATDLLKRKKEHVFVGGYEVDSAQALAGSAAATEEVFNFFGSDATLADVSVNNGRLSVTVFDKKSNNKIFDALTYHDPDNTTANKRYKWEDVKSISVWVNRKDTDNLQYNAAAIYGNWLPVPGFTAGDVTARGTRTLEGNSDVPVEFNQPLRGVKVKLRSGAGTTPNFQAEFDRAFLAVPGTDPAEYAVKLYAINEQRIGTGEQPSYFQLEELDVVPGMFSGAGTGLNLRHADLASLTWMTHVYVIGLYNKSFGIHPTVKQFGFCENVTS